MNLELLLENSGLIKGEQYFIQELYKSDEGTSQKPDVIVKLPDKKNVIIDAKVSLIHYMEYNSTEVKEEKEKNLKKHIDSIERHFKSLSEKNYEKIKDINAPDFVLMFMPLENALTLALSKNPLLYREAYKRKIILVSHSTLMISLRLIHQIWKQENQNNNAKEIANMGAKIYDKLYGFVEDLKKIGNGIKSTQENYDNAFKKLRDGRGNVLQLAENLKELGVNSKKNIDDLEILEG